MQYQLKFVFAPYMLCQWPYTLVSFGRLAWAYFSLPSPLGLCRLALCMSMRVQHTRIADVPSQDGDASFLVSFIIALPKCVVIESGLKRRTLVAMAGIYLAVPVYF